MVRHELDQVLDDKSALPPLRLISPDHSRIAIDDRWNGSNPEVRRVELDVRSWE